MDSQATPKQQVSEQLKNASSILVTTGKNPTVDEVASAIGLTYMLQNMDKHATAVISTHIPDVLEFLQPYEAIETTTDRLRDFVITFSKEKADKLRYKVIDDDVRIFITPYKTILTKDDLTFTQGDYNIDTVVVLGATKRNELDAAVLEHSRIMSDSTVVTINAGGKVPSVGSINWYDPEASSVAEMLVSISEALASGLLTEKSSQALLTGLVSATNQFSNKVTTPKVMTMAAQLMAAGADQQQIVQAIEAKSKAQAAAQEMASSQNEPVVEFSHKETAAPASPIKNLPPEPQVAPQPIQPSPLTNDDNAQKNPPQQQSQQETNQANATPQQSDNTSQQSPQITAANTPTLNIEPMQNDRIVLQGSNAPAPAPTPQPQEETKAPEVKSDKRERLHEKPKQGIDNPILSPPPTSNTNQPALNAHDHSQEEKAPQQPTQDEQIMSHPDVSGDEPKKQPNKMSESDFKDGPHINVHPDTPVLHQKQPQQAPNQNQQPAAPAPAPAPQNNQQGNGDPLEAAREAVAKAADAQPPSLPRPIESLSAQDMQPSDDGGITIDHNGNIHNQ